MCHLQKPFRSWTLSSESLLITFRALVKKQSQTDFFFCKNSQLYILRVLRQLYKQDDMHTAFLLIQTQSGPTEVPTRRARVKEKNKTINTQTNQNETTKEARKYTSTP